MILSSRLFILQGPIRADLSGRPFGFLFIWRPAVDTAARFALVKGRHFGFFVPTPRFFRSEILDFEVVQLVKNSAPHDCRKWPEAEREAAERAVQRKLVDLGGGAIVVSDRSHCDQRPDLTDAPWQLYRQISVAVPQTQSGAVPA